MKTHDVKQGGVQKQSAKTRRKDRNFGKNLSEYFIDYSSNTSIQGLRYLGETHRSIFERLFWIIALSTSIFLCSCLILQVYRKWQSGPVIVTFSNNLTPVWTVPFPAITICSESKTRKTVYDYEAARKMYITEPASMTEEQLKRFQQMSHLCSDEVLEDGPKISGNDTVDFIIEVAPTCDSWICRWNNTIGDPEKCSELLTPVLTDTGVCFTFNMLDGEELFTNSVYYPKPLFKHDIKSTNWSLERGYHSTDTGTDDYPRRTSAGITLTLVVSVLGYEPNIDYACGGAIHGHRILLHNPAEIPRYSRNMFMVSFDKQITVTVKPDMMTTSDELQNYEPQKRQCYYSYEKQLQYYKAYTQTNCDIECLTNNTLKICGCVAYYMPRNHATAICGLGSVDCMAAAERIMFEQETKLGVKYENQTEVRCNCLPSCTSLSYKTGTSEVDYKWRRLLLAKSEYVNLTNYTVANILFFYDDPYFITTERKELYGVTEFIANCGGFLGLFMGCSFISAVEVIYFLTVRLIVNVRNYGFNFWSGPPKIRIPNETPTVIFKLPLKNDIIPEEKINTPNKCFRYFGIPVVAPDPTTMRPHDLEKGGVPKKILPKKTTRKDRNFGKNLSEYFTDYCNNTTIQGIQYLGETRRSLLEKLFWVIALSTSIYLCSGLILQVYRKWQSGPVIVTFSNTLTPVWKVPFPAITICPLTKTRKTVYDYEAAHKMFYTNPDNMTEEELNHFEQIDSLCWGVLQGYGNTSNRNDTVDFILKVAPTCDSGWTCKWNNTQIKEPEDDEEGCAKVLTPVLTGDGLCFTFNMLDGEELFTNSVYYPKQLFKHDFKSTNWSLEKGYYSNVMGSDDYPRRTSAGFTLSFLLSIFGINAETYSACGAISGYRILLHNPAEIPRLFRNMFMVSFDNQITVSMKPEMMTTSDELQNYDPQKRQCYYSHEKQLQYYKFYTKSNCDIECNHTTAICAPSYRICMATAEKIMFQQEMNLDVMDDNGTEVRCNCLSSCISLTYTTATSEVFHDWKYFNISDRNSSYTQIYFFFNDAYFITTERNELYGVTEFIANCGGFLGLFMGCSFISVVEIIYFLTVRLIINVRNYGSNFWSGSSRVGIANEIPRKIFKLPPKKCITREDKVTVVDLEG